VRTCRSCGKDNRDDSRFCSWCGTALSTGSTTLTGLLPAQSLLHGGRFLILERVGQGGMGAVYKALDLQVNKRIVAVKEMSQSGLSGQDLQDAIKAFTHEAEMLARLKHQSLPYIYGQFEDGGRRYLVMEFIEGETLEHRLEVLQQQGKRLPIERVLAISRKLCTVLDYLHSQRPPIIFRDLKPSNIMLGPNGQVCLIDFGIARLLVPGKSKDTVALGSEGYAPPEQYRRATSPRSDIYSLGATLHQMLTGHDPSDNPFLFQPFTINMPELERLVINMVALDEKQRPANMNEVRRVLDNMVPGQRPGQPKGRNNNVSSVTAVTASSITIYAVVAPNASDQRLWKSLQDQITSLIDGFPHVQIKEGPLPDEDRLQGRARAIDEADLILLLLSTDFLSSPECMATANRALDRYEARGAKLLSVLLHPCSLQGSRLARVSTVPEDAIAHLSRYAQEQRILEVARVIRKQLIPLVLAGKWVGTMNLLQWLLWQLYGNGRTTCPYFAIGQHILKSVRASGLAGIVIHLFDLQKDRVVHEYLIGPIRCPDLKLLLLAIAPSLSDPETVQGIASQADSRFINK
jgi:serine/threonine protein kinase, bacterial